jgi:uroporphyrinogen-III synthase
MTAPLAGVRVLVTRPAAQAEPWCRLLRELGAEPLAAPLLAIEPVRDLEAMQAVKQLVLDFDLYQKAIFVSQNAVAYGMAWLEDYWPQLPQGIAYFAVGDATARQLAAHGVEVSALNAASNGAMNSESLLAAPELQQVAEQRIVIFRGLGGRGQLAEILRARGARVDYCELYQRRLPVEAATHLAETCAGQLPHVVALHSGESLDNYRQVLAQLAQHPAAEPLVRSLRELPLLVPGARVAALAQAAGFERVYPAENATDSSMLEPLLKHFSRPAPDAG